jgi:Leucine-rich repeat (LRR) protein
MVSVAFIACNKNNDDDENGGNNNKNQITMITAKSEVKLGMAGTDSITIDWGDGTTPETFMLFISAALEYGHQYLSDDEHTITITGNITEFECRDNKLTNLNMRCATLIYLNCAENELTDLNVSNCTALIQFDCGSNKLTNLDLKKCTALRYLHCYVNNLTHLDISKCTVLIDLGCNNNKLTDLDVSQNTALIGLGCHNNKLTNLDVSQNTKLTCLRCDSNNFSATALNALFETLHHNPINDKIIDVSNNPGANHCNRSIAENKGWQVAY